MVDQKLFSIRMRAVGSDGERGYKVNITFENKSTDTTYGFWLECAAVNGVQCNLRVSTEVGAGQKAKESILLPMHYLDKNIIGDYTDIELTFLVYDVVDWLTSDVLKTVHAYPHGKDKAVTYVRQRQESDRVIMDNEYLTVVVTDYEKACRGAYMANLFIQNKSRRNLLLSVEEMSADGEPTDSIWAQSVWARKSAFSTAFYLRSPSREGVADDEEKKVRFRLDAFDIRDWSFQGIEDETFILNI